MKTWKKAIKIDAIPLQSGGAIKFGDKQIALFHFDHNIWYAVQNLCPLDGQMIISRGLIGETKGAAKIACPMHKHTYFLESGKAIDEDEPATLQTYATKVEEGQVFIEMEV